MPRATRPARVRLGHVVFSLGIGGLETGLLNLIRHLDPAEFEHRIYCMKDLGPNAARAEALGVVVEKVGSLEGKNRTIIPKLVRRFRRDRPHIVHSRNFGCLDAVIAARLARVPHVVHGEHGWDTFDPEGRSRKRRFLRGALSPLVDRYITVSHDLGRWLLGHRGRFRGKIVTIPNGVDVTRFRPRPEPRRDSGTVLAGTVGRLAPIKDHAALIEAFVRLAPEHPGARLEIVGDGPLRQELEERARQSGLQARILLSGATSTPEETYRRLDLFVLPSRNEGISNTLLEAMASGLPIVATAVGGNPELVADGVTGRLVPKEDPGALAAAIGEYLSRPELRQAHGRAGRERAEREFSLARMAGAYRDVYLGLAGGAPGGAA